MKTLLFLLTPKWLMVEATNINHVSLDSSEKNMT